MPTAFTHQLISEDAMDIALASRVHLADYYFGAQGADLLFFYKFIGMRKNNLGRMLHKEDVYGTFTSMLSYVREHPNSLGYALGYVTHYAADAVFHPYVYYYAFLHGTTRLMRSICHTQMESDYDTYFLAKQGREVGKYGLPYSVTDITVDEIAGLYIAVFKDKNIDLTEKAVQKAVRGYFRYIKWTTDRTYFKGRFFRFLGRYSKNLRHLGAMFRRRDINENFLNKTHYEWSYRADADIVSTDGADELYDKAVRRSRKLIDLFLSCYYSRERLPKEDFCLHLLDGVEISEDL